MADLVIGHAAAVDTAPPDPRLTSRRLDHGIAEIPRRAVCLCDHPHPEWRGGDKGWWMCASCKRWLPPRWAKAAECP